jgi:glutamate 5-kinase
VSGAGAALAPRDRLHALLEGAGTLVVKVGSSSLATATGIDGEAVDALVDRLAARRALGEDRRLVVVTSGAIAAGLPALGMTRRPADLAGLQAAASVGQGRLLARWSASFARHDLVTGQVLLDLDDLVRRNHYLNARSTLARLLSLGAGTGGQRERHRGDRRDPLRGQRPARGLRRAPGRGLRAGPPHRRRRAVRPPALPPGRPADPARGEHGGLDADLGSSGSAVGTGGMRTKVDAAAIAADAAVPTLVTATARFDDVMAGEDVGTWFEAASRAQPARTLWLAHVAAPLGRLLLDPGAVRAVLRRGASLLPAGITAVEGVFDVGAVVDLCDPDGAPVARGLTGYAAAELPRLLGRSTRDLRDDLGPDYGREVVHRDDLVVLPPG